ncbi:hypothetical protein [Paenibacillus koleovorans]|uniref:hypothetical protein n=1 Tax=Paenibacillus koleovorans TaxID=121608 RepID=UPI000FDCDB19|nr:hypothetical protein [Paenibacillus koleovorans]
MKRLSVKELLKQLRKPTAILSFALLFGAGLNVMLALGALSPRLVIHKLTSSQAERLETEKAALEAKPIPVQTTETQVKNLTTRVPIQEEDARLIIALRQIEQMTGVQLTSITFGDVASKNEMDMLIIRNTPTPSPTATPKPANGAVAAGGPPEKNSVKLIFTSRYAQALAFMKQLQEQERLIRIEGWQFQTGADSQSKLVPGAVTDVVTVNIQLSVYTAKLYADKLPDLPPPSVGLNPTLNRIDPTLSSEVYWQIVNMTR